MSWFGNCQVLKEVLLLCFKDPVTEACPGCWKHHTSFLWCADCWSWGSRCALYFISWTRSTKALVGLGSLIHPAPAGWIRKVFSEEATWNLHAGWKCVGGQKVFLSMKILDHRWEGVPASESRFHVLAHRCIQVFLLGMVLTTCHFTECGTVTSELPHMFCWALGIIASGF